MKEDILSITRPDECHHGMEVFFKYPKGSEDEHRGQISINEGNHGLIMVCHDLKAAAGFAADDLLGHNYSWRIGDSGNTKLNGGDLDFFENNMIYTKTLKIDGEI
jgi:hypothetical protein